MGNEPIQLAKEFLRSTVLTPALKSELPDAMKAKVRHAEFWISKFRRVGDLLVYLKRFDIRKKAPMYEEMKRFNLTTFEDVVAKFEARFNQWAGDCSRINDFEIGVEYSVYDILILAKSYVTRSGGMFVLEADGKPIAVIIKASLEGGRYANEWLEEPRLLKYYLKSINGVFSEKYKANAAIIEHPHIPVLTFVRRTKDHAFKFFGQFQFDKLIYEEDGAIAFVLSLKNLAQHNAVVDAIYVQQELQKYVVESLNAPRDERLSRLKTAEKRPKAIRVVSTAYQRNADVISEVLFRAKGICEGCFNPAPFSRKTDGSPYLEVHHRMPLAEGGDDTVENAVALCPNCHRQRHFG